MPFWLASWSVYLLSQDQLNGHLQRSLGNNGGNLPAHHVCRVTCAYVCHCWCSSDFKVHLVVLCYILLGYIIVIYCHIRSWNVVARHSRTLLPCAVRLLPLRIAVGLGVPLERGSLRPLRQIVGLFKGGQIFKRSFATNMKPETSWKPTTPWLATLPFGGHQSPPSVPWFLALAKMTRRRWGYDGVWGTLLDQQYQQQLNRIKLTRTTRTSRILLIEH